MKLKKGDNIIIITGKDKGKKGKIVRVFPEANKVIVEGANMMKRHQRPKRSGEKGTMRDTEMPLNASNVMIVDPKSGTGSRLGKKQVGGKLVRFARKSNQEI